MANLSPANEARLRAAISSYRLQNVGKEIVNFSVECATLCAIGPDDYAQTGNSRYGGVPDLPDEAIWPQTKNGKFYQFHVQINLADVPNFVGNVLPLTGMLYCFMANNDATIILWADVEPSALTRAKDKTENELTNPDETTLKPYQIQVRAAIDVPEPYSEPFSKIEYVFAELPDEDYEAALARYEEMAWTLPNRNEKGVLVGPAYGAARLSWL